MLESQKEKEDELKTMKDQFNTMQSQVQLLISTLADSDQATKNEFARKMLQKGIYKPMSE